MMTLAEILVPLRGFGRIVVTGPQRSGTTIACRILADELGMEAVQEEAFLYVNMIRFVNLLLERPGRVIQAPALSSMVHLLGHPDVAVVFMRRDFAAIRQSEERIGWRSEHEAGERAKYFAGDSDEPISEIKLAAWQRYQRPELGDRAFELDYESLRSHRLWVDQPLRADFHARQTSIETR